MSRPRFHVPEARLDNTLVALSDEEAHHFLHVLRLGPGAEIGVFDGRGREWTARAILAAKRSGVTVALVAEVPPAPEPPVRVTLGVGLLKGDQMDTVVRDATMLGVAAIVPVISAHTAVASRAIKGDAARLRWHRVAVASAKQCRRAVVPEVMPARAFDALLAAPGPEAVLMCVEPSHAGAVPVALETLDKPETALALVGPEGGWGSAEIEQAARAQVRFVHLGPRTLRAETAPAVLLSALWTVWGW